LNLEDSFDWNHCDGIIKYSTLQSTPHYSRSSVCSPRKDAYAVAQPTVEMPGSYSQPLVRVSTALLNNHCKRSVSVHAARGRADCRCVSSGRCAWRVDQSRRTATPAT